MKIVKTTLLALAGFFAFSMPIDAQNCADFYKQAQSLKNRKNYADAINLYRKAKDCDPNLTIDCNKWIDYCRKHLPVLEISENEILIPYQGGDKQIEISANGEWAIDSIPEWCDTQAIDSKNLIIKCRDVNNSTRNKVTTLLIKNGSLYKSLKVTQEGRPEYIDASAQSLSFPAKGTEETIRIDSNTNWDVLSSPSWCKVEKGNDEVRIIVNPNDRVMERTDEIVIVSPNKSVSIKIYQSAGEEHLTLSQNNLVLSPDGDVHYMKIYTDADNWFVGDYPTWMNVQRIGNDSIRIECGKNIPNGESRYGSVQVKTDRQTTGVMVTQLPRMAQDLIFPDTRTVGGRNISFGASVSYYLPFVDTKAGGDYVGSVVDYGLGTSKENASYKNTFGYSLGVFADIRLYKNIFLIAGINFSQIKYKNEFNQKTDFIQPKSPYEYYRGELQNYYTENYTHTMLEVPILASYRIKIDHLSHVQLNIGPVLNIGLSAKMKLAGNSDSETIKLYNSGTNTLVDNNNYTHHTSVNSKFDLYSPSVSWTETYTHGFDSPISHKNEFQDSPFKKFNCGLRIGAAYEWAGISFGISYTYMLTNMANKNYWENERWTVLNNSKSNMKDYQHRLNTLEIKVAYTLRY